MYLAMHSERSNEGLGDEKAHPFCGQMGKIFVFSEVLTDTDVQAIYSLGPNLLPKKKSEYVFSFSVAEIIRHLTSNFTAHQWQ